MDGSSRAPDYLCASPRITNLLRSRNPFPDALLVTCPSLGIPVSDGFSNPTVVKSHSLGKVKRFNPHNSPRPPHAPAASFKSLYRKCSGPDFAHNPSCCCRSTSDRVLRTSGQESLHTPIRLENLRRWFVGRGAYLVGTRRLSSSNQFCTRIISVAGSVLISSSLTIRNPRLSGHRSQSLIAFDSPNPGRSKAGAACLQRIPVQYNIRDPHLICGSVHIMPRPYLGLRRLYPAQLLPDSQRLADLIIEINRHAGWLTGVQQDELCQKAAAIRNLRKHGGRRRRPVQIGNR